MKLTLDRDANVAYLRLAEKVGSVRTIEPSESIRVDRGPDGAVYGIEFLDAHRQILSEPHQDLELEDLANGKNQSVPLEGLFSPK
ncbi:MAG: DUF2283 domain-containing protein [Verrucomicrobia bacterium]|nr:DUF2283 domain-containing protein [Verrucomicrobiota bacterium]